MLVFATEELSKGWMGKVLQVGIGQVWDSDDPFVVANPKLFTATPPVVCSSGDTPARAKPISR